MATKKGPQKGPTLYKVTDRRGRSPHCGFKYDLPGDAGPGDWHRVEGELQEHKNGFHLTTDPARYLRFFGGKRGGSRRIFEAEAGPEVVPLQGDDRLAREVRLVRERPWTDFEESGAMQLLVAAWKGEGKVGGKSWRRLNGVMQDALRLAIEGHFEFGPDDFRRAFSDFNGGYWMFDGERYYTLAIEGPHGPNPTAIAAFERWKGRRPFLAESEPSPEPSPKVRLHIGAVFPWFHAGEVSREGLRWVRVTSFDDGAGSLVACSYLTREEGGDWERDRYPGRGRGESKIEHRYTITHDDLAAHHRAMREARKAKDAREAAAARAAIAEYEAGGGVPLSEAVASLEGQP